MTRRSPIAVTSALPASVPPTGTSRERPLSGSRIAAKDQAGSALTSVATSRTGSVERAGSSLACATAVGASAAG